MQNLKELKGSVKNDSPLKNKKKGAESLVTTQPLLNRETKLISDYILLTFAAAGPLGPSVISN